MVDPSEPLRFKTVTAGGSYKHSHMSYGQNTVTLHGVKCPACAHVFHPTPITGPAKCPKCGVVERP